jgi:hypothetical protein
VGSIVCGATPDIYLQRSVADEVAGGSEEGLTMTARHFRDPSGLVNPGAANTSSMWHV